MKWKLLVLCAVSLTMLMAGQAAFGVDVQYQVAASGDDTYWMNADGTWTTAQEAYCPYINNTRGGAYRWQLDIPDGATVVSAVMKLKATGVNGNVTASSLTLEVLDYDSCPSFSGGLAPQTDSVMSGVAVLWSIPAGDWTANEWYESCDVTDLVQAFVDRQNYASGNYIGIRATSGAGTYHKTFQYDSGAANGTILEVVYTTP